MRCMTKSWTEKLNYKEPMERYSKLQEDLVVNSVMCIARYTKKRYRHPTSRNTQCDRSDVRGSISQFVIKSITVLS